MFRGEKGMERYWVMDYRFFLFSLSIIGLLMVLWVLL